MVLHALRGVCLLALAASIAVAPAAAQTPAPGLAGTTLIIVRHAEKPASGTGLAPAGVQRAQAYVHYFSHFGYRGKTYTPQFLVASADSKNSSRPRLTITPLSQSLGVPIYNRYKDKQYAKLATFLESAPHGNTVLICWHHGEIPALLTSLGANDATLLPAPKWPANVFGWAVVLRYDKNGALKHQELVHENLMPDDVGQ